MATDQRLRSNGQAGTITDNPLASGATTINSAAFANLPVVTSGTDHLAMILDPAELAGELEIVHVTAHTASATVVTVSRAQEGTSARSHLSGTIWRHGPTAFDYLGQFTSATRPASPYEGQTIYEHDTDDIFVFNGTNWARVHPARVATRTNGLAVTTSGTGESSIASIAISAQNFPYRIWVKALVFHTQTVAGDSFALSIKDGGTITATSRGLSQVETLQVEDFIDVAAGGAKTINVVLFRANGTGTASTFTDGAANFVTTTIESL